MDERRNDRDSVLGDDSPVSSNPHENSDRDYDMNREDGESSDEGVNLNGRTSDNETAMDFARSPKRSNTDTSNIGHHQAFQPNHALNMFNNLIGVSNLQNLPSADVLEKLKMQVGLIDPEFTMNSLRALNAPSNTAYSSMQHGSTCEPPANPHQPQSLPSSSSQSQGFQFTTPNPPNAKDDSNSSSASDSSNSSQQNTSWSFEEQFKQVRQNLLGIFTEKESQKHKQKQKRNQKTNSKAMKDSKNSDSEVDNSVVYSQGLASELYEISNDPQRKEFLDDLFSFMQKRGSPINRLPIMAKSVLDLYELYNLVIARGGLVDVINKKLWQEIIKGLHLPSSITSAAFTLRTQYMKYLYPYECDRKKLSTPLELQNAIDGNRREGRRTSYGQYDGAMQGQLQHMQQVSRSSNMPSAMQQINQLQLVQSQAQNAHLLSAANVNPLSNMMPGDIEQRMLEYLKLLKENTQSPDRVETLNGLGNLNGLNGLNGLNNLSGLGALEMQRNLALWQMYNNVNPSSSNNAPSPRSIEPQREALNLTDTPSTGVKRERDRDNEDYEDYTSKRAALEELKSQLSAHNHYNEQGRRSRTPSPDHHRRNRSLERGHREHRNGLLDYQNNSATRRHMSVSPPSSNHRNGVNNASHNGSNDLTNGSQVAILGGMQMKVSSRGSESGEQQLIVSMEFNGVQYEGILLASRDSRPSLTPSISPQSNKRASAGPSSSVSANSPINDERNERVSVNTTRPLVS